MRRVSPLPSLLTLGNLTCGFIAVTLCLQSLRLKGTPAEADLMIHWACAVIFFAMVFDMLDGRVARMTGAESRFGAELDSLADGVTFGLAPPAILTALWIRFQPPTAQWWSSVMICGIVYASCAALRLARYNVEKDTSDKNYFRGLPSPGAAGAVVSLVLLARQPYLRPAWEAMTRLGVPPEHVLAVQAKVLGVGMLVLGVLMVTRTRFVHVTNRFLGGRKRFTFLVAIIFGLALLLHQPVETLFLAFNGYVTACLVYELFRWRRRRATQAERLAPRASQGEEADPC